MFKNSPLTNPIRWAEKAVGTKTRYIFMIIATACFGILIIFNTIVIAIFIHVDFFGKMEFNTPISWAKILLLLVFLVLITIFLPLSYLRIIRKLILERKVNTQEMNTANL